MGRIGDDDDDTTDTSMSTATETGTARPTSYDRALPELGEHTATKEYWCRAEHIRRPVMTNHFACRNLHAQPSKESVVISRWYVERNSSHHGTRQVPSRNAGRVGPSRAFPVS